MVTITEVVDSRGKHILSIRPTGNAQGAYQKVGLLGPLDHFLHQKFNNGTPLEIRILPRRLNSTIEGRKLFIGRNSEEIICLYRTTKSIIVFEATFSLPSVILPIIE